MAHFLLAHVESLGPEVDGWMALDELHPTVHLRDDGVDVREQEAGRKHGSDTNREFLSDPGDLGLELVMSEDLDVEDCAFLDALIGHSRVFVWVIY